MGAAAAAAAAHPLMRPPVCMAPAAPACSSLCTLQACWSPAPLLPLPVPPPPRVPRRIGLALYAQFGAGKFPGCWWPVAFCVGGYSLLSLVLNAHAHWVEGDACLICKPRNVRARGRDVLLLPQRAARRRASAAATSSHAAAHVAALLRTSCCWHAPTLLRTCRGGCAQPADLGLRVCSSMARFDDKYTLTLCNRAPAKSKDYRCDTRVCLRGRLKGPKRAACVGGAHLVPLKAGLVGARLVPTGTHARERMLIGARPAPLQGSDQHRQRGQVLPR